MDEGVSVVTIAFASAAGIRGGERKVLNEELRNLYFAPGNFRRQYGRSK
jgi:hypothetical protein